MAYCFSVGSKLLFMGKCFGGSLFITDRFNIVSEEERNCSQFKERVISGFCCCVVEVFA